MRDNPPSNEDYLTYEKLGIVIKSDNPEVIRMSQGLSVMVSLSSARKKGKGGPWRGNGYIAIYDLPDDDSVVLEQTGKRASHYTVSCDSTILRASLRAVIPIIEGSDDV